MGHRQHIGRHYCKPIDRATAIPFIQSHHYLGKTGNFTMAFGLFDPDRSSTIFFESGICGVILYGQPYSKDLPHNVFFGGTMLNSLELTRMAVLDECICPRTFFIAHTIKYIKENYPEIKCLISFADKTHHHFGYVYQASNWIYTGQTEKIIHYKNNMGKRIAHRTIWDLAEGRKLSVLDYCKVFKIEPVKDDIKFRYVYPLSKSVCLKMVGMTYPKGIYYGEKAKKEITNPEAI